MIVAFSLLTGPNTFYSDIVLNYEWHWMILYAMPCASNEVAPGVKNMLLCALFLHRVI
jgi:hypothetical protein